MPDPVVQPAKNSPSTLLADADKIKDSNTHFGLAIYLSSNDQPTSLIIPDINALTDPKKNGSLFMTKPVVLKGENLKALLTAKGITLPESIRGLVEDTDLSCEAFYYTSSGPLLMVFSLKFDAGLLTTLLAANTTADADAKKEKEALGKLFEIKGASLRVLRCPDDDSLKTLQKYVSDLKA